MTERARASSLREGAIVGGYRVLCKIGEGGGGAVYAGEEPRIKKRVAIKVLRRAAEGDASALARFEREARAVNEIKHPGIVDIFAFGELDDGRPYLVMSLLEGRSLGAELEERGRLDPSEAWSIARQVADALAAAHEAGVVHRDMKPDNVFLERPGGDRSREGPRARAKILDFGLAKLEREAEPGAVKLTQSGAMVGTPAYTAPEQWWNVDVDGRTDQYAFGVMLYEMLAGRPPFASAHFLELAQQHMHEPPPPLPSEGGVTPEMDALVRRALAKAPADRFASMRELIEEGDRAFGVAGEPSPERPAAVVRQENDRDTHEPEPKREGSIRARVLGIHLAILAFGAAAVLALGYTGYARHNPIEWALIAGRGSLLCAGYFVLGAVLLPLLSIRAPSRPSIRRWWLPLLCASGGAFTTFTGFGVVSTYLRQCAENERLKMFYVGMFEANAARFIGFSCATLLCLSIAALASPFVRPAPITDPRAQRDRRETIAATAGFVILAAGAIAARAPSGAFIAAITGAALAIDVILPIPAESSSGAARLDRSIAEIAAVIFSIALGYARVVAREAVLWQEQPSRADRIREIIAADAERTATLAIAIASLAVVARRAFLSRRRRRVDSRSSADRGPLSLGPRADIAALAIAAAASVALDVTVHVLFLRTRDELRASLAPRFSLFSRLDPPLAPASLDPALFPPHPATAMQITEDAIALNAAFVAKLRALDSPEGSINVGRDLNHALGAAESPPAGAPELSLSVDQRVTFGALGRALRVARSSGVRRAELLLTRGRPPVLPASAPAEAAYVLASDFLAIPIEIAEDGFRAEEAAPLSRVADELAALAARDPGRPVRVAVP